MNRELALVMPIYNEEGCISDVVQSWHDELTRLRIDFIMILLNDGSQDNTVNILDGFNSSENIMIVKKANSGHGQTVLMGYNIAVKLAEWVFQTDSDNEMKSDHFTGLWNNRLNYDAVVGYRVGRIQSLGRRLISAVSRVTVRMLFGRGVIDVNVPYRLIRSSVLSGMLQKMPVDTFAPNIIISGILVEDDFRIFNQPVPFEMRQTGAVSIVKWQLWKAAARSFKQIVQFKLKIF